MKAEESSLSNTLCHFFLGPRKCFRFLIPCKFMRNASYCRLIACIRCKRITREPCSIRNELFTIQPSIHCPPLHWKVPNLYTIHVSKRLSFHHPTVYKALQRLLPPSLFFSSPICTSLHLCSGDRRLPGKYRATSSTCVRYAYIHRYHVH